MPGHEVCRLFFRALQWHLKGTAIFTVDKKSCQLHYHIVCDSEWNTRSGLVEGWIDQQHIRVSIRQDAGHNWWLNDVEILAVAGCTDLDLNFSPSTNTIAIRRLQLAVGGEKQINAAWLKFPAFTLEKLVQNYQRLDENLYRYESGGGRFLADLRTDHMGFVIDYPGIWQAEDSG